MGFQTLFFKCCLPALVKEPDLQSNNTPVRVAHSIYIVPNKDISHKLTNKAFLITCYFLHDKLKV